MATMNNNNVYMTSFKMDIAPAYEFLSQPPPQRKRLIPQPLAAPPLCQLPPTPVKATRRSSFTVKISTWAAHVQPGSPAPVSPHPRPSLARRGPVNLGLSSLTAGIGHARVPTSPFIATPTPTTASHKTFDFTTVGYNTIFVHMPKTPETPSPLLRAKAQKEQDIYEEKLQRKAIAKEESKEKKVKIMKRIRSLTNLRPRAKSVSKGAIPIALPSPCAPLPSPTYTTATAPMPSKLASKPKSTKSKSVKSKNPSPVSTAEKKKAAYGALVRPPPSLANELALMQFIDGGKMDDHIKRVMTAESGAVGDVYRDGKGGVWWDREEELEYRGLLVDANSDADNSDSEKENARAASWVKFEGTATDAKQANLTVPPVERRGSASSASTLDSDLDPTYLMQTEDAPSYRDDRILNFDLPVISKAPESPKVASIKPGPMLLSLPARPFRTAKHLRKPEFMVDMQAFGLAMSNAATEAAVCSKSPRSPLFPVTLANPTSAVVVTRRRSRKRPAPLKISPAMMKMRRVVAVSSPGSGVPPLSAPAIKSPALAVPMIVDAQHMQQLVRDGKREFMMDSFQPEVSKFEDDSEYDFVEEPKKRSMESGMKKRASRLDLRGMFGSRKE